MRAHLLVTIHSGELASLGHGDDELGASIIATLGQWRVAEALPFLQDMALGTECAPVAGSRTAAALTQTLAALGDLAA